MFWKFSYTTSQIQTILEKTDVTLQEILDEDDVLQECKANNEKLISFLTQYENLNQLVTYVTVYPSHDQNENSQFKYSTIASELLTCDVTAISESLIGNVEFIEKLYSFLYNEPPLNPLLASYFSKVIGSLISRKTDALLNYLQNKNDFVSLLLKHINTSAVLDVLLRLLTTIDNAELRQRMLAWLNQTDLTKRLVGLLSHQYSNETHSNVSQLLCDIVRILREQILTQRELQRENIAFLSAHNNDQNSNSNSNDLVSFDLKSMSNPLLDSIESIDTINMLLGLMFESASTANSSMSYGIDVLLTLLEPKTSTIEFISDIKSLEHERLLKEQERIQIACRGIKCVTEACIPRLKDFHGILTKTDDNAKPFEMTFGVLKVPFGTTRLNIIKMLAKLVATNNTGIVHELQITGLLSEIIDLTFEYRWNNFLHMQTANIITSLFTNTSTPIENEIMNVDCEKSSVNSSVVIIEHLLKDCNLIEKLLNAWQEYFESSAYNPKIGKKEKNSGNIGHLTIISNLIIKISNEGEFSSFIQSYFDEFKENSQLWREFEETKLTEINKKNSQDLVRNPLISSSTDFNAENEFIDLPSEESMQRKFTDLSKDMTPTYPDAFGISENNITNLFGKNPEGFSKLQNIAFQSFHLEANEDNAQMFDQICSQRDSMRDAVGDVNDEDVWVACEIKYAETHDAIEKPAVSSTRIKFSDNSSSSSSSDEEDTGSRNDPTNISKSRGGTDMVFTTAEKYFVRNSFDQEMDFQNSNDVKLTSTSEQTRITTSAFGSDNWADFANFNNVSEMKSAESAAANTEPKTANVKINSSHDEDNNWANFDSFDGFGNERCSSPNDTPTCFQLNKTETVERSKAYVYTEQSTSSQVIDSHAKSETNSNDHTDAKVDTATQEASTDMPIAKTVFTSDKALFIDQNEFTSIDQAMTVNDPIENTMSIDER